MLKSEFLKLQNRRDEMRKQLNLIAKDIGEAASRGDLSENAEFDEAKERRERLIGRIRELETHISDAMLVDVSDLPEDTVCIGKTITLRELHNKHKTSYNLVSFSLSDSDVTCNSPLGKAMIGKRCGDKFSVDLPGESRQFQVVAMALT
jgi:transcription elongation factor GreA